MAIKSNAPFVISIDTGTSQGRDEQVARFVRQGGRDLIENMLRKAGLSKGLWTIKLHVPFVGGPHTPPFQVVRAIPFGVMCKVKPGNNGTATQVILLTKDREWTAEEVAAKLSAAARPDPPQVPPPPQEQPPELDPDTRELLLVAVSCVHSSELDCTSKEEFANAVAQEMGPSTTPSYWKRALARLTLEGYLQEDTLRYRLTEKALEILNKSSAGTGNAIPAAAIADGSGSAPSPLVTTSNADVLLAAAEPLTHILGAAQRLQTIQAELAAFNKQSEALNHKIRTLEDEKASLLRGADLRALVDVVRQLNL